MTSYLIIDTETNGLKAPIRPIEIAWIHIDEDMVILNEHCSLVNPLAPIDPGATAIHGYTDQDVAFAPEIEGVVGLMPQPFTAIAHNVQFDLRVLGPYIEYNGDLCTLALSRRWVKNTSNHKLSTLKTELKLSEQVSHSALGDCHTTLELLRLISKLSGRTLVQLHLLESVPRMLQVMPFGMHRGKRFDQVPRSYREWLRSKEDLHKDLKYTLDNLRII